MYATLRPAPPPPGQSIAVLDLAAPGFGALWHHHDTFELNAIMSGTGMRWIGAHSQRFGPGDIVLVPPGVPHSWVSDPSPDAGLSKAVVVMFSPAFVDSVGAFSELGRIRAFIDDIRGGALLADPDGRALAKLRQLPRKRKADRLLAFLSLLAQLARAERHPLECTGSLPDTGARERSLIGRAIALVNDAERGAPRQTEVAAALSLSPAGFSRLFRRGTGMTYTAFVDARRIDRACDLLQRDALRVGQIADAVGFDNLSNFNRRFRAATGETPTGYRARFKAAMD